jgi:hypothetical protein
MQTPAEKIAEKTRANIRRARKTAAAREAYRQRHAEIAREGRGSTKQRDSARQTLMVAAALAATPQRL